MARSATRTPTTAPLPDRVAPQVTQLVDAAPAGDGWLHEIKYDGYRMHARLDRGAVKLLTRTGLDWTHKYPAIAKAVAALDARQAYLDGELCGGGPDGITSFNIGKACAMPVEGIVSKRIDKPPPRGSRFGSPESRRRCRQGSGAEPRSICKRSVAKQ